MTAGQLIWVRRLNGDVAQATVIANKGMSIDVRLVRDGRLLSVLASNCYELVSVENED